MRVRLPILTTICSMALLFSLGLTETGLQLWYRVKNDSWLWENSRFRIGYTAPVTDRRQYALRPGYVDKHAGITITGDGFRETVPAGRLVDYVIICAGDSVPFGAGVKDAETYSSSLARLLADQGLPLTVVNAGVPSYNLRQSVDRLAWDVFPLLDNRTIPIVTIEAANDISLLAYYKGDWHPDRTWADVRWSASWMAYPHWQMVATFFYLSRLNGRLKLEGRPAGEQSPEMGHRDEAMIDNVRIVLRRVLTRYQKRSIPVLLLPINPFYYQTSGQTRNITLKNWHAYQSYVTEWDTLIERYNGVLQDVSREFRNAYFFDTRPIMDSYDRDLLYIDYIHLSPMGNHIRAESLLDFLVHHRLISFEMAVPPHRWPS